MNTWQALGFQNYIDYLCSAMWKDKSKLMIEIYPYCKICKVPKKYWGITEYKTKKWKEGGCWRSIGIPIMGWVGKNLIVHHSSYESVGNENQEHLMVLCRDCHTKVHNQKETKRVKK